MTTAEDACSNPTKPLAQAIGLALLTFAVSATVMANDKEVKAERIANLQLHVDQNKITEALSTKASAPTKRLVYAVPVAVSNVSIQYGMPSAGAWENLGNGWSRWQTSISSFGAKSLDFGFANLDLPKSAVLTIQSAANAYDQFSISQNMLPADRGEFWTAMVKGDKALISMWAPTAETSKVRLKLTTAHHGFVDIDSVQAKSGSCNVDTICVAGQQVAPQTRAVARYTQGGGLCSGALVANSGSNPTEPNFLTANHCISTASAARGMVMYWGYESETCRTGSASGTPISLSRRRAVQMGGGMLLATRAMSDFTLVRFNQPVPAEANAFWAGWTTDIGPRGAFTIHHPAGHEKRVSYTDLPLHPSAWYGTMGDSMSHHHVPRYSVGTTEGGSSGAPLFDHSGAVIGQLHGGPASCTTQADADPNNDSDWYGSLRASYEGGGTPATRLSDWIDPANLGAMSGVDNDGTPEGSSAATRGTAFVQNGMTCSSNNTLSGGRYWLQCSVNVSELGGSAVTTIIGNIPWGTAGAREPVAFITTPNNAQYPAAVLAFNTAANPLTSSAFWSYHTEIHRLQGTWSILIGSRNRFGSASTASGEFNFAVGR